MAGFIELLLCRKVSCAAYSDPSRDMRKYSIILGAELAAVVASGLPRLEVWDDSVSELETNKGERGA